LPTRQFPPEDVSITAAMSSDGRYVGFYSTHNTLAPNDTNDTWDVFVLDQRTDKIRRISVSSTGAQGNMASFNASLSADGRFIAFTSAAGNLVPRDTNLVPDVFLHDTRTGRTTRVSVSSAGVQANETRSSEFALESGSHLVSMSVNGRYVLFRSTASNLVRGDTNGAADYFLHDRVAQRTDRISVSSTEQQANADSRQPLGIAQWAVSEDGRFVFFNSDASNLVAGDGNGAEDLFVRDLARGVTRRVSVSSTGAEANSGVGDQDTVTVYRNVGLNLFVDPVNGTQTSFSATPDGRYVAFSSGATNLVPGDGNGAIDVFLRHVPSGTTTLLSVTSTGEQGDGASNAPVLSADGGFVAFQSAAGNLVPGDTNGNEDIFTYEVPSGRNLSGWH
jgi:Tol biopolymer transport system component